MLYVIEKVDELYDTLKKSVVGGLFLLASHEIEAKIFESTLSAFLTMNDCLYEDTEDDKYSLQYVSGEALELYYITQYATHHEQALKRYDRETLWESYVKGVAKLSFPTNLDNQLLIPTVVLDEAILRIAYTDARGFIECRNLARNK
jgi:hypothetical protein